METRTQAFKSLPWYAKAILIALTPPAFAWIVVCNLAILINNTALFWMSE